MRLDTHSSIGAIEPSSKVFKNSLVAIAKCSKDRTYETQWAQNLRFLTPMLERSPLPTERDALRSNETDMSLFNSDSDQSSLDTTTCVCDSMPRFSHNDKRLRLTRQGEVEDCVHYLAVSYCLNSTLNAGYNGQPYSISTETGSRSPRCSSALLERVITYADYLGYSFIWVDQECIEQDNADDKQRGIHSMDLVYQGAAKSVAVLETQIQEQRRIDALECLCDAVDLDQDSLLDIVEALELVLSDHWFHRAWTLQESTSASRSLVLMIRYSAYLRVPYSLWLSNGNLELELSVLHNMLSSWLPLQLYMLEDLVSPAILKSAHNLIEKWFSIIVPDVQRVDEGFDPDERSTCNAAEALAYLSPRMNTVISDRLAIMANLCKYDVRLDLLAVEEGGFDFSVCAIALSAMNGDMSIFAGQGAADRGRRGKVDYLESERFREEESHGFSWCLPQTACLEQRPFLDKDVDVLRINVLGLSSVGLRVRGCTWFVDEEIDVEDVGTSLRSRWTEEQLLEALDADIDIYVTPPAHIRSIKVAMLMELLCTLIEAGFRGIADLIWETLRLRPTQRQLDNIPEASSYASAGVQEIINFSSKSFRMKNPFSGRAGGSLASDDPFHSLTDRFSRWLLRKVIRDGVLPVARPSKLSAARDRYRAVFETAELGDVFFSPENNFGLRTPTRQYGWYSMNWKVVDPMGIPPGNERSFTCRGLMCGCWQAEEEWAEIVVLR